MGVSDVSPIQAALESIRHLPRSLVGGTPAMRLAGRVFLPQNPAESNEAWEMRRDHSFLLPAYSDAIDLVCGLIFRKKIEAGSNVPSDAAEWLDDIDKQGSAITQFTESVLRDAFNGVSYVIADYPAIPSGLTRAQEMALDARPYLVHVKCEQVLGWRFEIISGKPVLTQFRYKECVTLPDGQFGSKSAERIRVLEPGMVSVYVRTENGEWVLDPENSGLVSLQEVPVVAIYTGRTGFMTGAPPLLNLAWKNIEHWQSASDQRNILHVARVPLLSTIGIDGDIVIGPQNILKLPLGGDAKWIEHTGAAIDSGRQDLQDLEVQMQRMAGKILDSGIAKTARQSDTETTQAQSKIQAWALGLQAGLNQAWALCGKWIGQDLGEIAVNCDVDTSRPDPQLLTEIRNAEVAGLLPKGTYMKVLATAEVLPEGFDVQEALDKMEMQGPDIPIPPRVPAKAGGAA